MEALIIIFLVTLLIVQSIKLWREKKYSEMVECSWDYRIRVAQIESELISIDPESSARKFVSFLANICMDKETLIGLYDLAESSQQSEYLTEADLKKNITDLFSEDYSALVYEASIKTGMASILLAGKRHGELISKKQAKRPEPEITYIFKLKDDPKYMDSLSSHEGRVAIA